MKQLFSCFAIVLIGLYNSPIQAQSTTTILFADFLERLPKPAPTAADAFTAYGSYDRVDNEMRYAYKEIDGNLTVIYEPLLEQFKKNSVVSTKTVQSGLSKEEQNMVVGFKVGTIGIPEEGKLNAFKLMMDQNRPLISTGKLSWTKVGPSASAPVQKLYQQLKQVEAQMDWPAFTKQAEHHRPKLGATDETLEAIHKKFEADFRKLPKKKVQLMEGFSDDVEDPDGALALLEQYKIDWQKAFERYYATRYMWWQSQYIKLSSISKQLDSIALQTNSLVLNDADRMILSALADLQGRVWEAWQRLSAVSQGLFMDAAVSIAADQQVASSINIYRKYKTNTANQ